jgi:hypothetical protein
MSKSNSLKISTCIALLLLTATACASDLHRVRRQFSDCQITSGGDIAYDRSTLKLSHCRLGPLQ